MARRFVQSGVVTPALNIFFKKDRSQVSTEPLSKFPPVHEITSSHLSSPTERISAPPPPLISPSGDPVTPPQKETKSSSTSALHDQNLDSLEISPLAFALVEEISRSVLSHQSAALLVDYGEDYPQVRIFHFVITSHVCYSLSPHFQGDTLRGFKNHAAAHVLSEPGMVDISADVNFKACAQVSSPSCLYSSYSPPHRLQQSKVP